MNDSVYGKIMENIRKRVKVRLVTNAKDYKKWVSILTIVSKNLEDIHEN